MSTRKKVSIAALAALLSLPVLVTAAETGRGSDEESTAGGGYYKNFKPYDRWAVVTAASGDEGTTERGDMSRRSDWLRRMYDDWQ